MEYFDRNRVDDKRRDVDRLMRTAVKHYVRSRVWLPAAIRRAQLLGRPIQYFTLTTADLYDVKLLENAGILTKSPRGYPGLGFCEFNDLAFDNIIRKLGWCGLSYKGYFEQMVHDGGQFGSTFDFDVVNLDFISVPFPENESPLSSTWGAIEKLLAVQWNNQTSFDLFLTFNGRSTGTDSGALDLVADLLQQNLNNGRGVTQFQARIGHVDPNRLLREDYVTFLCVGIPKLLVGRAVDCGFEVTRNDVYLYSRSRGKEKYYIVKFVLSLDIPVAGSNSFFAVPPPAVAQYDAIVPQIFEQQATNVSNLIDTDPALEQELIEDFAQLEDA